MVFALLGFDATLSKGVGFDNTWLTNGQQMSQGLFQDFMGGYLKPEDSLHYWLNIV